MKFTDLLTGYTVQLRDGTMCKILTNVGFHDTANTTILISSHNTFNAYYDNFKHMVTSCFDIVRVYDTPDRVANILSTKLDEIGELLWCEDD